MTLLARRQIHKPSLQFPYFPFVDLQYEDENEKHRAKKKLLTHITLHNDVAVPLSVFRSLFCLLDDT